MKLHHRRKFLHLAAGTAALPLVSQTVSAQAYPSRPVHVVVGFPPGQAADISARLLGQWLSERLGQSFVIDNRPGAAGELFKMVTGINMFHVPYRGSAPALGDLISGQVHVMFDLMASSIGYIRAGQLRALAVTAAQRSEALPELPTVADFVPGYEASTVGGIGAPKRTPTAIVNKLNTEINTVLANSNLRSQYAALGSEPDPMSPTEFGKVIVAETEKWGNVVKFAGVEPE